MKYIALRTFLLLQIVLFFNMCNYTHRDLERPRDQYYFDEIKSVLFNHVFNQEPKTISHDSVTTLNNEIISLSRGLIDINKYLVLNYFPTVCEECFKREVELLNNRPKAFKQKTIIMLNGITFNQARLLIEKYGLDGFNVYFGDRFNEYNALKNNGLLFYFVLNSNQEANFFYYPNRNLPELTKEYYEKVFPR